jgi:hypothetical protein
MENIKNTKCKSIKLDSAKCMPPLYHKLPDEDYSSEKSQVIKWLIQQPHICEFVWDKIKQSGDVKYNPDTGKWQGVDYECDKNDILRDVPRHVGEYNKPKPSCYDPCEKYEGKYTKCRGEDTPNSFAENDCSTCCWLQTYHDLVGTAEEDSFEY